MKTEKIATETAPGTRQNDDLNAGGVHAKASVTTSLDALRAECAHIRQRLGHRQSRCVSRCIYTVLVSSGIPPAKAADLAQAVTRIKPSAWLTAKEAQAELRHLGIRKSTPFFYRRRRRMGNTPGVLEFWLDAKGNCDAPGQVEHPVAVLCVRSGYYACFRLAPLSGPVTELENP